MIEPEFMSVPELAERWKQTPRQIIEHANSLRFALYFLFDGLAFDRNNNWYSGTGAFQERRELEHLNKWIPDSENHLARNAIGLTDEFSSMDAGAVMELRAMVEQKKGRREDLKAQLEDRETKRNKFHYRGYLRAAPETLIDIARNGETPHPLLAYHPQFPTRQKKLDGELFLDGNLMRLESLGHWKPKLCVDDLLASMREIKALEGLTEPTTTPKPIPKKHLQITAIIETMKTLGYAPTAYPAGENGSGGVKAEVWLTLQDRRDLFPSKPRFNTIWQELRDNREIGEAKEN